MAREATTEVKKKTKKCLYVENSKVYIEAIVKY